MKLVQHLGAAETLGPIVVGLRKPVHVLHYGGTEVNEIVHMVALAVVDAQSEDSATDSEGRALTALSTER